MAKIIGKLVHHVEKLTEGFTSLGSRVEAKKNKLHDIDNFDVLNAHVLKTFADLPPGSLAIKGRHGFTISHGINQSDLDRIAVFKSKPPTEKPLPEQQAVKELQRAVHKTASAGSGSKDVMLRHIAGKHPERASFESGERSPIASDKSGSMKTAVNRLEEKIDVREYKQGSHELKPVYQEKNPDSRINPPVDFTATPRMADVKKQSEIARPAFSPVFVQQHPAQGKSGMASNGSAHSLQYTFSQWGGDHHVAISLSNPGSNSIFHPSDMVVQHRMMATQWDDKAQQNRWMMSDADGQSGSRGQQARDQDESE